MRSVRECVFRRTGPDRIDRYFPWRRYPHHMGGHAMYFLAIVGIALREVIELRARISLDSQESDKADSAKWDIGMIAGNLGHWKPIGNTEEYPLDSEDHLGDVIVNMLSDSDRYAIPFYERYGSAEAIVREVDAITQATPAGGRKKLPHGLRTTFLAAHLAFRGVEGALQFVREWPRVFRRVDEMALRNKLEAALRQG